MIKSWILALAAVPLVVWLFVRVPRSIVPEMQSGGTEQILAQWRDALQAYHKEHGKFPPQKEDRNFEESLVDALTSDSASQKPYLDLDSVPISQTLPMDGWGNGLVFDPGQTGAMDHIISPGPDGIIGNADDLDSRQAKQRHLPVPPDPSEDLKVKGRAKGKSKSKDASKDAPPPPADPTPEVPNP